MRLTAARGIAFANDLATVVHPVGKAITAAERAEVDRS